MPGDEMKFPGLSIAIMDKPGKKGESSDIDDEQIMFEEMASDMMMAIEEGDHELLGAILRTIKDM